MQVNIVETYKNNGHLVEIYEAANIYPDGTHGRLDVHIHLKYLTNVSLLLQQNY